MNRSHMGRNANTTIKVHIGEKNSMKLQLKLELFGILAEKLQLESFNGPGEPLEQH